MRKSGGGRMSRVSSIYGWATKIEDGMSLSSQLDSSKRWLRVLFWLDI